MRRLMAPAGDAWCDRNSNAKRTAEQRDIEKERDRDRETKQRRARKANLKNIVDIYFCKCVCV